MLQQRRSSNTCGPSCMLHRCAIVCMLLGLNNKLQLSVRLQLQA